MLDPVTLATLTSAVSVLAAEYSKGIANEAGKSTWQRVKALFSWDEDPKPDEISTLTATTLQKRPDIAKELLIALRGSGQQDFASQLVGSIDADKVIVVQTMTAPITM